MLTRASVFVLLVGVTAAAQAPDPAAAVAAWERGRAWYAKGDYDRALAEYDAAVRLDPANPASFLSRGCARGQKRQWAEAVADFDEVVRLSPRNAWGFYNRGYARAQLGELGKAIRDFDEAVRLDPRHALAFHNRGNARFDSGDLDRAVADYDAAARLDPTHAPTFLARGAARAAKRDYAAAERDFSAAARLDANNPDIYLSRAAVRLRLRDWAGAAADAELVTRLDPSDADGWLYVGESRKWLGEWKAALAGFDEAIRLDPRHALAHANRAFLRASCPDAAVRDGKKAVADADRACDLSRMEPYAQEARAAAAAEAGDFVEAVRWQREVLDNRDYVTQNGDGVRRRLELYEARMPFRGAAPSRADDKNGGAADAGRELENRLRMAVPTTDEDRARKAANDRLVARLLKAESLELLWLDPRKRETPPEGSFHGYEVIRRVRVERAADRAEVVASLGRNMHWYNDLKASCFSPRHGLRVTEGKDVVDLVICFECSRLDMYRNGTVVDVIPLVGRTWAPAEKLLRTAGKADAP